MLETKATNINVENKTVEVQDKDGKNQTLEYDSLILATGASPFIPPIKGREKPGIHVLRTIETGRK